ncbi:hypothetical protein AXF04_05300 [Staphylococcus aureus]|nr:hypothetical protein [Staphylococcus aureus]
MSFRNSLCWGPHPKSLLQVHFRSVNYCQYNFVEHRTLIYVPAFCLYNHFEQTRYE